MIRGETSLAFRCHHPAPCLVIVLPQAVVIHLLTRIVLRKERVVATVAVRVDPVTITTITNNSSQAVGPLIPANGQVPAALAEILSLQALVVAAPVQRDIVHHLRTSNNTILTINSSRRMLEFTSSSSSSNRNSNNNLIRRHR